MEIVASHCRQSACGGQGINILVVSGEAGVGKSRLLREVIEAMERERMVTVHLKLHVESAQALGPLLATAITASRNGQSLLRSAPQETPASVVETLHRFARLRPTVIVIEDIHLLAGEPLREFAGVLEGISDESIPILCATRPLDSPARGVLERWPMHEIVLEPLSRDAVGEIWQSLFEQQPSAGSVESLWRATLGNPLALRAAIRGAMRQGALARGDDGRWTTGATFATAAARSVRSLTDGMSAHLGEESRIAAERLAALGEVFSRTAGLELVESHMLENLIRNGIIYELATPRVPIPGLPPDSDLPLAFSHSLIHRQFAERTSVALPELLAVARTPLYSIHPFRLIAQHDALLRHDETELHHTIEVMLEVARLLNSTPDWSLAPPVWEAASALLRSNGERFDTVLKRTIKIKVAAARINLLGRTPYTEDYARYVEQILDLTEEADTEWLLSWRIRAFAFALNQSRWSGVEYYREICEAAEKVVASNPALRFTDAYIYLLRNRCRVSGSLREIDYKAERRAIEQEYQRVVEAETCTPEQRRNLLENVAPYFLLLFDTNDELENRRTLYSQMQKVVDTTQRLFMRCEIDFLCEACDIDALLAAIARALPLHRTAGELGSYYNRRLLQLWCEGMLGRPHDEIERDVAAIDAEIDAHGLKREYIGYGAFIFPCVLGFLLGRPEWSARMIETYLHLGIPDLESCVALLVAHDLMPKEQIESVMERFDPSEPFVVLTRMMLDSTTPLDEFACLFRRLLHRPTLTTNDLLILRVCLDVYQRVQERGTPPAAHATLSRALAHTLDWLAERRLHIVIEAFLGAGASLLSAEDVAVWRSRAATIGTERVAERSRTVGDARVHLSMLGRIEVQPADGSEPLQPQGARQKAFLGALVASEMLDGTLGRAEFLDALGIGSDDSKRARDAVNSALYRLREIVGRDAIIPASGDEAPRLNRTHITVDLLDAYDLLRKAAEELRQGAVGRAGVAVQRAVAITRGEVPFPGLYDSFFEALREEFDTLLRSTLLQVARRLLREEDVAGASELLERAFAHVPDDEEIAELYRESLEAQGRRAEAERVRRKVEVV